ncbi:MAG: Asp-tRNA(Asn)/Glu-tRNA(Gln) amidotransferase subunit GatA [Malacoplasma sp.]|nr:Asp-tRNA(Asn)/Glu-tRNA(Gln) amidotransferase subunit GatA [Malacoplasma sp.]
MDTSKSSLFNNPLLDDSHIIKIQKKLCENKSVFNQYLKQTYLNLEKTKPLNAILSIIKDYEFNSENQDSLLNNILYAVKDNINVKNTITTGGSLFFENYKSPYSATVIEQLDKSGAIPVCKTNLDEFGLGGTGLFSGYGDTINPIDKTRIPGGSSSGSAVLTALNTVVFALGTDTGDSIRMPASYLGVYGFKPSYGIISRFGVFPYSPSIDHVGVFANSIADIAIVMDCVNQYDPNDFTSQNVKLDFLKNFDNVNPILKVGYFENIVELLDTSEKKIFFDTLNKVKQKYEVVSLSFDKQLIDLIPVVYEILSYSEAVSCYQNITGITFGKKGSKRGFEAQIKETRSQNFGKELKRRFVLGSFTTLQGNEDLLNRCKQIRRLIVDKTNAFLNQCDFFIMPGSSSVAPKIEDVKNHKAFANAVDNYLQIANFGGFASLTIPNAKINGLPIGINIMGQVNSDALLLAFAKQVDLLIKGGK